MAKFGFAPGVVDPFGLARGVRPRRVAASAAERDGAAGQAHTADVPDCAGADVIRLKKPVPGGCKRGEEKRTEERAGLIARVDSRVTYDT